jgi:hypothetical protein
VGVNLDWWKHPGHAVNYSRSIRTFLAEEPVTEDRHSYPCLYAGPKTFACNCGQETLFGPSHLWWCFCCEKPRAREPQGLCDLCKAHEYDPGYIQEMLHDA